MPAQLMAMGPRLPRRVEFMSPIIAGGYSMICPLLSRSLAALMVMDSGRWRSPKSTSIRIAVLP
jgi:hypothetical protein